MPRNQGKGKGGEETVWELLQLFLNTGEFRKGLNHSKEPKTRKATSTF